MQTEITDVYELMKLVRKRPSLYMGGRSFERLLGFVAGLGYSKEPLANGNPSFSEYVRWITGRVRGISTTLPWSWMEEKWGSERAFDAYFEFLEEYSACVIAEIAVAVDYKLLPTFWFGDRRPVPLPRRLFIGQYAPSMVFFLGEEYDNVADASPITDTENARISKLFPYQNDALEVMEEARHRWTIPISAWKYSSSGSQNSSM